MLGHKFSLRRDKLSRIPFLSEVRTDRVSPPVYLMPGTGTSNLSGAVPSGMTVSQKFPTTINAMCFQHGMLSFSVERKCRSSSSSQDIMGNDPV